MKKHIILALDGVSRRQALRIAKALGPSLAGVKVNDALDDGGARIIRSLAKHAYVFADAKLKDIPATVANRVRKLTRAGAHWITVHASGGKVMMRAAVEAARDEAKRLGFHSHPLILAVTVLTSMDERECYESYGRKPIAAAVVHFAHMADAAGVDGIICSPQELSVLRRHPSLKRLLWITPGVRSRGSKTHDQRRTMTPEDAVALGASAVVVGREVMSAKNRKARLRFIERNISVARRTRNIH